MKLARFFRKSSKDSVGRSRSSSTSSDNDDLKPMCGVFVSSRTLSTAAPSPPSSFSSHDALDDSTFSGTSSSARWTSAGLEGHHKGSPLVVENLDEAETPISDPVQTLGKIMARSKQLPDTWYYSSNHVLVNQERTRRAIAPLIRMRGLDEMARIHAQQMAEEGEVFPVDLHSLRIALTDVKYRRLGVNVQKGENVRRIHDTMMMTLPNKNNIVDRRFTHMGMGTAVGSDGSLYLCQIFRG